MSLLRVELLLDRIRQEYQQSPPRWILSSSIPPALEKWIHQEAHSPSEFDALRLRQGVLHHPNQSIVYATCPYGSLVVYLEKHDLADIPWELWGRILRLCYEGKPFTIYLLAHSTPRRFPSLPSLPSSSSSPSSSSAIKPEHINGGYTYPCRTDTIVIYRAEDATRVLLHELQHASCLDHPEKGVDRVEAETEAWAELLYTAFLARGDPLRWNRIWSRQWAWIQKQNERVRRHIRPATMEFPWRYTVGKEEVLREWFPSTPSPSTRASLPAMNSLRLTAPPTAAQKREQGIRLTSTFL